MSNERLTREKDSRLADTYRALAQERVPDHLNNAVLGLAARSPRTAYSRTRAWIRPMAWAATIGLSIAIVLEITRLPETGAEAPPQMEPGRPHAIADGDSGNALLASPTTQPGDETGIEAEPAESALQPARRHDNAATDIFAAREIAVDRGANNTAPAPVVPEQSAVAVSADLEKASPPERTARQIVFEAKDDTTTADDMLGTSSVPPDNRKATAVNDQRAAAARTMTTFSNSAAPGKKMSEADRPCPAPVRQSARSWLACISDLREDGRDELAAYESEEFSRMFPGFAGSTTDK